MTSRSKGIATAAASEHVTFAMLMYSSSLTDRDKALGFVLRSMPVMDMTGRWNGEVALACAKSLGSSIYIIKIHGDSAPLYALYRWGLPVSGPWLSPSWIAGDIELADPELVEKGAALAGADFQNVVAHFLPGLDAFD